MTPYEIVAIMTMWENLMREILQKLQGILNYRTGQTLLLGVSITLSGLVLWGQRKASIRESIEQLDDRTMPNIGNHKIRPLLHDVRLRSWKTTIAFRYGGYDYNGISNPQDIRKNADDLIENVKSVEGVMGARFNEMVEEAGADEDGGSIEERHVELYVDCQTLSPAKSRKIADSVLSQIRATYRAS